MAEPSIFGLEAGPLPEGAVPLAAVAVVKFLDDDGEVRLALRLGGGPQSWETIGMLTEAVDNCRDQAREGWGDADA